MTAFDLKAASDAARGALDARRLAYDLRHGVVQEGVLGDRLRTVYATESPAYCAGFTRVIEKAVVAGGMVL
jgi:hypothetical protein